ncbi:MAG: hypothetical protein ABW174_15265, partial [Flavitalea sp.]
NQPVADAQVAIDGTPYFTLSRSDGSFVLQVGNYRSEYREYRLRDDIVLRTTHVVHHDSDKGVKLAGYVVKNVQVLLP